MKKSKYILAVLLVGTIAAKAAEEDRIKILEDKMASLSEELTSLKQNQIESGASDLAGLEEKSDPLTIGGYGEFHANFQEGGSPDNKDIFDIHRLVLYVGYQFNEWIKLTSETELEHAFINDDDGEISIEQLYADFLFGDFVNVRAGRMLAPLGIINQNHEPTLFFGVERPNVDKYIIPSTWSVDGAGIFGSPLNWLSYQLYAVAGLDGSAFSGSNGVRSGRIKERASFNDPAVTGRIDIFPFVEADLPAEQELRLGFSGYHGGTDNMDEGKGETGLDNTFTMWSADFEYDISRFRFRGIIAQGEQSDVDNLAAGVGEEIFGWYLEAGVSVMPDSWKKGKLEQADLLPFVRYEEYDTQRGRLSGGGSATGDNERQEVTVGINLSLTHGFVAKADYQFKNTKGPKKVRNQFNLGMGWVF